MNLSGEFPPKTTSGKLLRFILRSNEMAKASSNSTA